MGNCLKSNKVEPFEVRNNSAEMLERRTPDRRSAKSKNADMIQSLMAEGTTPNVAKDGLAFVVDFSHGTKKGKKGKKPPNVGKKVSDTGSSTAQNPDVPEYTAEERALMAEIMREEILKEKKEKARNIDVKIYDAKRKRMAFQAQADAISREEQEKALKVEAARAEKLKEKKEKARQAEMKAYDVKRRKMALEAGAEALKKDGEVSEVAAGGESSSDGAATSTN